MIHFFSPWFMIHSLRDDVIHDSFTFLAVIRDSRFRFHPRQTNRFNVFTKILVCNLGPGCTCLFVFVKH